jgi:hypothetical protein
MPPTRFRMLYSSEKWTGVKGVQPRVSLWFIQQIAGLDIPCRPTPQSAVCKACTHADRLFGTMGPPQLGRRGTAQTCCPRVWVEEEGHDHLAVCAWAHEFESERRAAQAIVMGIGNAQIACNAGGLAPSGTLTPHLRTKHPFVCPRNRLNRSLDSISFNIRTDWHPPLPGAERTSADGH